LEEAVEGVDDVIAWLAENLETEIARSLSGEPITTDTDVCQRLPKLVALLAGYEERLADFDARLEHEKLEAIKELAYGAGHEINNPLANIAARAQTLLLEEKDPERMRKLLAIHRQAMRAHEMIADLMLFARPPKLTLQTCDVRKVVEQVIDGLAEVARERDAEIVCKFDQRPLQVRADLTQLGVAIHALVVNALEAIDEGGRVEIESAESHLEGDRFATITIRDDGPGISDEVRRQMFDPFFSGREAGRGLGFGLSKCWRIVTDHGGRVTVHKPARGGAQIVISIPASQGRG
jgi:signal transduction histidine kinase